MGTTTASTRSRVLIAVGALGVVALVAVVMARRGASDSAKAGASSSTNTTLVTNPGAVPPTTATAGSAGASGANGSKGSTPPVADKAPTGPPTLDGKKMPLKVSVSDTSHLRDGDTVSVHVVPEKGSLVYGFEGFLCAGGATFTDDADIRPLQTGKCATQPLSSVSDKYTQVRAAPPYQSVDGTFRVGVGTNGYTVRDGGPVTIACGPSHPCQLVLKLQYPNSYGFAAYPLSYG